MARAISGARRWRPLDGRLALVFGVTPSKVLSSGKGEHYSQTRYRFAA
jgi:hypothetical protein